MTGRWSAAVLAAGVLAALAACGGGGSAGGSGTAGDGMPAAIAGTGRADRGDLHVRNAYIPQQASPDVAAGYFSVTDDGAAADRLVRVTTPVAPEVSLHETVTHANASSMQTLADLEIPAHGTALLSVGGRHLMLMKPVRMLRQGETVTMTLRFAHVGDLAVTVPVVGFTGPAAAADPTHTH